MLACILLKQDYVYAKGVTQEGTEVINFLSKFGPPTLITTGEIYKVRDYIKIYMQNIKLMKKSDK